MSLLYYLRLLDYRDRIEGFRRGIEAAVDEGARVLDLGCGIGTFAFFAVRAGAERVWAVDADPVVHAARSVARANRLEDRIEFVRGRVPDVELPVDFDVLVFEDFPRRLLDRETHDLLHRVHADLLAPGARTVPRAVRVAAAPARDPDAGRPAAGGGAGLQRYGIDFSPLRPYLPNEPQPGFLDADALLADPARGPSLPLLPPAGADELRVEARWRLEAGTRVDALVLWFDLEAAPGEWISNAPGPDAGPWGQTVLPLDPPLRVADDGVFAAEVGPEAGPEGAPDWLRWRAAVGGKEARGHEFGARPAGFEDLFPDAEIPFEERGERGPSRRSDGDGADEER